MKMNLVSDSDGCLYFHEILFSFFKLETLSREDNFILSEQPDAI